MKRNSFIALFAMLALCLIVTFLPYADAQSSIVTESGSTGFKPVTTQSLTVPAASAVIIGTMPPACRYITVTASGATMYYGDENVTTTGLYPCITTGQSVTFEDNATRNPSIYFRALSTATAVIGIAAR